MSLFHRLNWARFTASVVTRSDAGSRIWGYEPKMADQAEMPSTTEWSSKNRAHSQTPFSGAGTPRGHAMCLTKCVTKGRSPMKQSDVLGPFTSRSSGNVGQEILDGDGVVVAWTTDGGMADLICRLLTDHDADQHDEPEEKARKGMSNEHDVQRLLFVAEVAMRVSINSVLLQKIAMDRAERLDLLTENPTADDELNDMIELIRAIDQDQHLLEMYCY